ncbi:MAG: efflux RND transporter periplasmic adaptor subunit [Bryobacterales bacterium]|nr:efflux RND transporter periplasmic adaptor subunit [Bryobacterales bacterium]
MPRILLAFLAVGIFLLLAGCGKQTTPAVQAESAIATDPNEIKLDENLAPRVKVGEVQWATVGASFSVAGRVEVDETRTTRIGSPVMGRITSLAAVEGQDVKNGQVLATILSTGLSDAQLGFLKALSQKQVAQRAVDRAEVLLKADVIGSAELQRREAELAEAGATLDAARDQLLQLGMPPEAVEELRKTRTMNSVSRIVANMDGTVMERKVTPGQMVQPADTIYEIADLSQVWMVADVPEANAGHLRVGQVVEASIAALPGIVINGKLAFVSATVNPETRTVMVRLNVPNRDKKLKPAMLATMELKEHTERQQVVPLSAIVRDENRECLFVQRDNETFALREVKLGDEYTGKRVLLEGIRPGERIVIDGAFHLNNERRRRAVRGAEGS